MKQIRRIFRNLPFLMLMLLLPAFVEAQQNIYVVRLKDKNNSPYSLDDASKYLSQKALDRRHRQHISLITEDLPVTPSYKAGIAALGVKIRLELKWFNSLVIQATPDKVAPIQALSYVASVSSLGPVPSTSIATIKPFFKHESTTKTTLKRAATSADYGLARAQVEQVNGNVLHNLKLLGEGMTIAVLDAGFPNLNTLAVFDSLRLKGRVKGTHDFTYTANFLTPLDDPHGTEVLSLLAGWLNGAQIGTAPNADYYLLRTEDARSETPVEEYNWAAGAAYADSVGADIISSSLGYFTFDPGYTIYNHPYSDLDGHTTLVTRAAEKAAAKGMLVVNAAGNEGASSWQHIIAPADADTMLTIGAVNAAGTIASFSSRGPTADGRIKPDVVATGWGTELANPVNNNLVAGNGTSFSTPIVAGLCACLWQGNPEATNTALINAVRITASQSVTPDNVLGYGIPAFYQAYLLLRKQFPSVARPKPDYQITSNPFKNNVGLIITSFSSSGWSVDIFTIQGRLSESHANIASNQPILIGNSIKPGVYLLRIRSGNQIVVAKIIKN